MPRKPLDELTAANREVLAAIVELQRKKGYSPDNSEVAQWIGVHRNTVAYHVNVLKRKKLVRHTANRTRDVVITEAGRKALGDSEALAARGE